MKKKILAGLAMGLLVFGSVGIAGASDLFGVVTELVSINRMGTNSGNGASQAIPLSADGRFVEFASFASDLVATDTNGATDVFVRPMR